HTHFTSGFMKAWMAASPRLVGFPTRILSLVNQFTKPAINRIFRSLCRKEATPCRLRTRYSCGAQGRPAAGHGANPGTRALRFPGVVFRVGIQTRGQSDVFFPAPLVIQFR